MSLFFFALTVSNMFEALFEHADAHSNQWSQTYAGQTQHEDTCLSGWLIRNIVAGGPVLCLGDHCWSSIRCRAPSFLRIQSS